MSIEEQELVWFLKFGSIFGSDILVFAWFVCVDVSACVRYLGRFVRY